MIVSNINEVGLLCQSVKTCCHKEKLTLITTTIKSFDNPNRGEKERRIVREILTEIDKINNVHN